MLTKFSTAQMCASLIASRWNYLAEIPPGTPPTEVLNELLKDV